MSLQGALLFAGVKIGVGSIAACAYGADTGPALVFSSIDLVVQHCLSCLIDSYLQETRQATFAHIAITVTSGLVGVWMTRIFGEKKVDWKQAIASSVTSSIAMAYTVEILDPRPKIA